MRRTSWMVSASIFFVILAAFLAMTATEVCACGGGGGGGGGDDDSDDAWFVDVVPVKNPTAPSIEEIADAMGPVWASHNIIDPKTGLTKYQKAALNQGALEMQAEQAERNKLNAETAYSASSAAGTGATIAAGVVATIASGGSSAVAVTAIGIGGDALAAGAGSVADSMVTENKSFTSAVKSAVGPAVAKGTVSAVTSKISTGSKVVDGILGTAAALSYDGATSEAPNSAPAPSFSPPDGPVTPGSIAPVSGSTPSAI